MYLRGLRGVAIGIVTDHGICRSECVEASELPLARGVAFLGVLQVVPLFPGEYQACVRGEEQRAVGTSTVVPVDTSAPPVTVQRPGTKASLVFCREWLRRRAQVHPLQLVSITPVIGTARSRGSSRFTTTCVPDTEAPVSFCTFRVLAGCCGRCGRRCILVLGHGGGSTCSVGLGSKAQTLAARMLQ